MYSPSPEKQQRFQGVLTGRRRVHRVKHSEPEPAAGRTSPSHLFTRSCSFCMGSGSPSRPQVRISLPSYTRMMRSAVFMRKQLHGTEGGDAIRDARARNARAPFLLQTRRRPSFSRLSPALTSELDGLDGRGVAGAGGDSEGSHQLLSVCVQHQDLEHRRRLRSESCWFCSACQGPQVTHPRDRLLTFPLALPV